MSVEVSERSLEETIECGLLQHGPDACAEARSKIAQGNFNVRLLLSRLFFGNTIDLAFDSGSTMI